MFLVEIYIKAKLLFNKISPSILMYHTVKNKKTLVNLVNYSISPSFLPIFTISITFPMQMDFNLLKFIPPNVLQSLFTKLFTTKVFLLYGTYTAPLKFVIYLGGTVQ